MALTIDGANKLLILDTATTWNFHDIYVAVQDWAMLSANMKYILPSQGSGQIDLGGSVATDAIYKILDGWNLKPSGYSSSDTLLVSGTVVAEDGTRTVPATVGGNLHGCFRWLLLVLLHLLGLV